MAGMYVNVYQNKIKLNLNNISDYMFTSTPWALISLNIDIWIWLQIIKEPVLKMRELFIQKSTEIFAKKYDYTKVEYSTSKKPVIITCPLHGDFLKSPNNHISKRQGCPKCTNELKSKLNSQGIEKFIEKSKKYMVKNILTRRLNIIM